MYVSIDGNSSCHICLVWHYWNYVTCRQCVRIHVGGRAAAGAFRLCAVPFYNVWANQVGWAAFCICEERNWQMCLKWHTARPNFNRHFPAPQFNPNQPHMWATRDPNEVRMNYDTQFDGQQNRSNNLVLAPGVFWQISKWPPINNGGHKYKTSLLHNPRQMISNEAIYLSQGKPVTGGAFKFAKGERILQSTNWFTAGHFVFIRYLMIRMRDFCSAKFNVIDLVRVHWILETKGICLCTRNTAMAQWRGHRCLLCLKKKKKKEGKGMSK